MLYSHKLHSFSLSQVPAVDVIMNQAVQYHDAAWQQLCSTHIYKPDHKAGEDTVLGNEPAQVAIFVCINAHTQNCMMPRYLHTAQAPNPT